VWYVPLGPATKQATQKTPRGWLLTWSHVEQVPMMPTIYTVAADGTHIHSPAVLSDTSDNNQYGYQTAANNNSSSSFSNARQEGEGMVRQIWNDFLDDILGPQRGSTRA
jgi:hypothetical protein